MRQTMQDSTGAVPKRDRSRKSLRVMVVVALVSATALLGIASPAGAGDSEREIKVSGVGYPGGPGDNGCNEMGADYTIFMTGDIEGCVYGIILSEQYEEESGEYQSRDHETFIGTLDGLSGSWEMDEAFWAVFDTETGDQLSGRCEHPIIEGSGTGDFATADGELRFVDNVENHTAVYFGVVKLK